MTSEGEVARAARRGPGAGGDPPRCASCEVEAVASAALVDRQPRARAADRRAARGGAAGRRRTRCRTGSNPIVREYRRASSTAIDASLKPLMQRHLREMDDDLRAGGLPGELLVVTSFGGVLSTRRRRGATRSTRSTPGPRWRRWRARLVRRRRTGTRSSATRAARASTSASSATATSSSRARPGSAGCSRATSPGSRRSTSRSIGAGGGSIAWIDSAGLLRVGPAERRAPCPARPATGCGGIEPTVTDAAVVLGYIDPDYFLGGRIKLDADRAARGRADERGRAARPRSSNARPTAILAVANEHMVTAIQDITINEGLDPRDVDASSRGGGAGGMTIARIAEQLGCRACSSRAPPAPLGDGRPVLATSSTEFIDQPPRGHEPLRLRRGQRGARRSSTDRSTSSSIVCDTQGRAAAQGVLRRGALPVPGLGARGAARARQLRRRRRRRAR